MATISKITAEIAADAIRRSKDMLYLAHPNVQCAMQELNAIASGQAEIEELKARIARLEAEMAETRTKDMNDNIKISITGDHIWARQTGPDSVEVGEMPGRGSYDKDTHVAVSKTALCVGIP